MSKNSFFVKYEFKAACNGFFGEFSAEKLYCVEYESERKKLVDDVTRTIKTAKDFMVTFDVFTGWKSISTMRVLFDGVPGEMSLVEWKRQSLASGGALMETNKSDHIAVNKWEARKLVKKAIEAFEEYEKEE